MQKYVEITEDTPIEDSREMLLNNDKTVASHYAGTAFPTENLVVGMECYRTDENRKYRLTSLSPVKWEAVLSTSDIAKIKVDNAAHADSANNVNTLGGKAAADLPNTYPAGVSTHQVYNNGYPCAYGNVLTIKGLGTGATQFCMEWSGGDPPGVGNVWFRNARDNIDKWSGWRQLAGGGAGVVATADNANKLGGLALAGARNNVANQVVRTDGNGYAQFGWINTTSGAIGSINKIYCSNDDYIRYMTVANFKTALGINNVENTADANKNVNTAKLLRPNTLTGANAADIVYAQMADSDYFRIRIGGTGSNAGYAEIATADDGTEPIYVRQYTGVFSSLTRTATLLDGSGNTSFPGTVTASSFNGTAANANKLIGKNWYWSGQGGQPAWLWGGSDGANMYVYNPSNFRVANANTVADLGINGTVNNGANKIVRTQGNGYTMFGYINSNVGVENGSVTNVIYDNGDGYFRKCSLAHLANKIQAAGGGSSGLNVQMFTSSGTFTVPAGVKKVFITAKAGGGGGGYGGAGRTGGIGGSVYMRAITVSPSTSYAVTIGAGGAGVFKSRNGGAGGVTSFGNLLSITGGTAADYDSGTLGSNGSPQECPYLHKAYGAGGAGTNSSNYGATGAKGGQGIMLIMW